MLGGSRFGPHAASVRPQLVLFDSLRKQDTTLETLLTGAHLVVVSISAKSCMAAQHAQLLPFGITITI